MENTEKKYNHIILLGETCELGMQYVENCGQPESHLFTWCNVFKKSLFLNAMKNPEIVMQGKYRFVEYANMFDCFNSGCRLHIKSGAEMLKNSNGEYDSQKVNDELIDLQGRCNHLADKLHEVYKSPQRKLFVYKTQRMTHQYYQSYQIFCKELSKILKEKTTNFDILFVVQKDMAKYLNEIDLPPNIYIREVKNFTRIPDAVNKEVSDNESWTKIFTEFRPVEVKKNTKTYKYQKIKSEE